MTQFVLGDLQKLVKRLEADLRERSEQVAEVREPLEKEYAAARAGQRTLETYGSWREAYLNQAAVAWVLSCVFVRYLEDNQRIDEVWLAGEGERMEEARERHAEYFRQHPLESDRDYFHHVFRQMAKLPGCSELFAEDRNPLWRIGISGDGARELLEFWQARDEKLKRSFQSQDTRFLGDLYQDLSQEARKRYALLQTPEFVEEFILDYTLKPAIQEFGLEGLRMIDPACGSGHFLLGGFQRLLNEWQRITNTRDAAAKALASVRGIDVNPFAVAIARFRLAMAFVEACAVRRLKECPEFHPQVFCGDSLLHGVTLTNVKGQHTFEDYPPDGLVFGDYEDARRVLMEKHHVVVGNPPYIVDADKAHNAALRSRYRSCHMQFSLGVPFTERFFDLATSVDPGGAGWIGMITANSFMKREFGKKLIEETFKSLDISHIVDTAGAYIPGHGTPTIILFGRNRRPSSPVVRAAMNRKGEPSLPVVPSEGLVWSSILRNLQVGGFSEDHFTTCADLPRTKITSHPISLGGGGATELLEQLLIDTKPLQDLQVDIGFTSITRADDLYFSSKAALLRNGLPSDQMIANVEGDKVRDWSISDPSYAIFPYDIELTPSLGENFSRLHRLMWPHRELLWRRREPNGDHRELGITWFEWSRFIKRRFLNPVSITFAFVATHNHFVLDRGGKVFNRTAPVIKLPEGASEEEHLAILGLLNSATANFWIRQTSFSKGGDHVGNKGARVIKTPWEDRLERAATTLEKFPITKTDPRTIEITRKLDRLANDRQSLQPENVFQKSIPDTALLGEIYTKSEHLLGQMVALQEELDWLSYGLYGLLQEIPLASLESLPNLKLGERAFEMVMAESGEETSWFKRHDIPKVTELPTSWNEEYKVVVKARLALIKNNSFVELLERPEHKRRWSGEAWDEKAQRALRTWLLDRLENPEYCNHAYIQSVARLAEQVRQDPDFLQVLQLYEPDTELLPVLTELIQAEGVPYLAVSRYSESGLRKHREWQEVWELQRREDRGEKLEIPVPPKYGSGDFASTDIWRLRGKLDVPKERFILYPGAERDNDRSLVIGWAGWDHLQRAMALAAYYNERKENDGWDQEKLRPLLAGLAELVPWLKQWHNEVHPEYGERLGDFYEVFVNDEARNFGLTWEDLEKTPNPQAARTRRRSK